MSGGDVQRELEQLRADIYGGRGPGIGDDELRRRTTLRPCVGNLPTAWLREELRLRTMRLRGDRETAQLEEQWAGAQFETRCADRGDQSRAAGAPSGSVSSGSQEESALPDRW